MQALRVRTYIGQVDHVAPYHAFIIVEGLQKDIFVPTKQLHGAVHEDIVKVAITGKGQGRLGRLEGKVIEVVKRAHPSVVGTVVKQGDGSWHVIPDNRRLHDPIILADPLEVQERDKVLVKVTHWRSSHKKTTGTLSRILGQAGSHQAETAAIKEAFALPERFDPAIEQAVANLPAQLPKEELVRRRDFRAVPTMTIDPLTAQDFDDALSITKTPAGAYEIGIHIADVTYYVKEGTSLDSEALKRGTSVYMVGDTVSMLPHRLANDLCSLRPREERPAFSVVVTMDDDLQLKDIWIGETIICSDHRFTYEEAHQVIQQQKGVLCDELLTLDKLAKKLREARMKGGAIAFETTETDIVLNAAGEPVDIKPKKSTTTHQLIEEFMLLANRLVAEKIFQQKKDGKSPPFLYRIHEPPAQDKVTQFANFVKQLGYEFHTTPKELPHSFNHVLKKSKGTLHETMLQTLAIRTMTQARYGTDPIGHYGLGFDFYTHFTSPIRRYPDLVVHRLTKHYLQNGAWPAPTIYQEIAIHTSIRERVAVEAERASINFKQVVFMKNLEGQEFDGVVSGITEWGIYVELVKHKCEGMVRLSDLTDDRYVVDAPNFRVYGKRSGKGYQIGQPVRVYIKKCNIDRKTVDLAIVSH